MLNISFRVGFWLESRFRKEKNGWRMSRRVKIDQADRVFSLYIRTRDSWKCQRCGAQHEEGSQGLHCSHFYGRRNESTRHDPVNCTSLCHGCHSYFTANPAFHAQWQLERLGEKEYNKLMVRANQIKKKDRKKELIKAKKLLANLN